MNRITAMPSPAGRPWFSVSDERKSPTAISAAPSRKKAASDP